MLCLRLCVYKFSLSSPLLLFALMLVFCVTHMQTQAQTNSHTLTGALDIVALCLASLASCQGDTPSQG